MLALEIQNKDGLTLTAAAGENGASLGYFAEYAEGDRIIVRTSRAGCFIIMRLDDSMNEEFVYLAKEELVFNIPFNEKRISYSPKNFYGSVHVLSVRAAREEEIALRKNLARNCYDQHGDPGCFPHAHANVETRGEAVFAARNAINGNCLNASHGSWPFESWGINMQDDAEITLEFGRTVEIDHMTLVTRADFPHDNYWQQVSFAFSDGSTLTTKLEKSAEPHEIPLETKKRVSRVKLFELIKDANDPSPFPALSQWMVYGTDITCR